MKIIVVVVALNELNNILLIHNSLVTVCNHYNIDYIYVDGNSNDGSLEFFKVNSVNYTKQIYSGRGGAIKTAFDTLTSDAFIVFSPDGNENIYDIVKFVEHLQSGSDLVIASRMMVNSHNEEDDNFFKPRKWANNVFNYLANKCFNKGVYVTDSINGYRAITRKALETIKIDAIDYTIEYQMTIRAMKCGLNIREFPTIEGKRIFGKTGAPSIPTGFAFVRAFLKELNSY